MYTNGSVRRDIERLRQRRRLLAAGDDFLPPTRTGLQRLQQQLATDAAASKQRNSQLLQQVQAVAKTQLNPHALVADAQLCALRGAYLTMMNRTFDTWYATEAQHVQQQQAASTAAAKPVEQQIINTISLRTANSLSASPYERPAAVQHTRVSATHAAGLQHDDSSLQHDNSSSSIHVGQKLQCASSATQQAQVTGKQLYDGPVRLSYAAVEQLVSTMSEQLALLQQLTQQQLQQPTAQYKAPQAQQQVMDPQQQGKDSSPSQPVQHCASVAAADAVVDARQQAAAELPSCHNTYSPHQFVTTGSSFTSGCSSHNSLQTCKEQPPQQQHHHQEPPGQQDRGACMRRVAELEQMQWQNLQQRQQRRKEGATMLEDRPYAANRMQPSGDCALDQSPPELTSAKQVAISDSQQHTAPPVTNVVSSSVTEHSQTPTSTVANAMEQHADVLTQIQQAAATCVTAVQWNPSLLHSSSAADPLHQQQVIVQGTGNGANDTVPLAQESTALLLEANSLCSDSSAAAVQDVALSAVHAVVTDQSAASAVPDTASGGDTSSVMRAAAGCCTAHKDPEWISAQAHLSTSVLVEPGPANSDDGILIETDLREQYAVQSVRAAATAEPGVKPEVKDLAAHGTFAAEATIIQVKDSGPQEMSQTAAGAATFTSTAVQAEAADSTVTMVTHVATKGTVATVHKTPAKAPPPAPPLLLAALASSKHSGQKQLHPNSIGTSTATNHNKPLDVEHRSRHVGSTVAAAIAQLQQSRRDHLGKVATPQAAAQTLPVLASSTTSPRDPLSKQKLGISSSAMGLGAAAAAAADHVAAQRTSTVSRDLNRQSMSLHNPDSHHNAVSTAHSNAISSSRQSISLHEVAAVSLQGVISAGGYQAGNSNNVLLSPATRLSLGAVGNEPTGRPSLSSESEASGVNVGSHGRWSLGGCSVSGGAVVQHPALQPPLKILEAVVPGTRRSSIGDSTPEKPNQQVEQLQQQQVDAGFSPLSSGVKRLGSGKLSVSKLVKLFQSSTGGGEAAQATREPPSKQHDSVVVQQQQQQQQQHMKQQQPHVPSSGAADSQGQTFLVNADTYNSSKAVGDAGRLVSKVLKTGLTEFDDSESGDDDRKDGLVYISTSTLGDGMQYGSKSAAAGVIMKCTTASPAASIVLTQHNARTAAAAFREAQKQKSTESDDFDF